jgi:hypothetical protein
MAKRLMSIAPNSAELSPPTPERSTTRTSPESITIRGEIVESPWPTTERIEP